MSSLKYFLLASRPKTLAAAVVSPLSAYFYALHLNHRPPHQDQVQLEADPWAYLLLCLAASLMIQVATNLFNDVLDHEKGADKVRLGPIRVTASGLVPAATVKRWAYICLFLAFLFGIPLIIRGGIFIAILGAISLYLSYGYTGGVANLAYRGLGEIFVFLFFGLFSFLGSYYLFTLSLTLGSFYLASSLGLLATTLMGINNLRDRESDALVKKLTLATRMSKNHYKLFCLFTIFLPYVLFYLALGTFQFLWAIPAEICAGVTSFILLFKEGPKLNEGLKFASLHMLTFLFLIYKTK